MGCGCGKRGCYEEPKGWAVTLLYISALGFLGTLMIIPQMVIGGIAGSAFFFLTGVWAVFILRRQAKTTRS